MRTTVSIDDGVYEEARRIAFETRQTLGKVINDLLVSGLRSRRAAGGRELGQLAGSVWIADDFDQTPSEIIDAFEGDL